MLLYLSIKNFLLIEDIKIDFDKRYNVITGETGAGKSILLGALNLLLGNRIDKNINRYLNKKCVIEASFQVKKAFFKKWITENDIDYEEEMIVRREISVDHKSRVFINDSPSSLEKLRILSQKLMDIHSQYDNLLVKESAFQLNLLDQLGESQGLKTAFQKKYYEYKKIEKEFERKAKEKKTLEDKLDYLKFLHQELEKMELSNIDQKAMETEMLGLEHTEKIKENLHATTELLDEMPQSISSLLQKTIQYIEKINKFSPFYKEIENRLNSISIEVKDISTELETHNSNIFYNAQKIEEISKNIDKLYHLQKKHQVNSVDELIKKKQDLAKQIHEVNQIETTVTNLKEKKERLEKELLNDAEELSQKRKNNTTRIEKNITSLLIELGMPNAKITFNIIQKTLPTSNGIDQVNIYFSANKGMSPTPLENSGSGGELSRLMLIFKYLLAQKVQRPVILFDEIDVGISGNIASKISKMLQEMSQKHQIITITHLPHIVAGASKHFLVFKTEKDNKTSTHIKGLKKEEQILEIAKMISGAKVTQGAIEHAKELIVQSQP